MQSYKHLVRLGRKNWGSLESDVAQLTDEPVAVFSFPSPASLDVPKSLIKEVLKDSPFEESTYGDIRVYILRGICNSKKEVTSFDVVLFVPSHGRTYKRYLTIRNEWEASVFREAIEKAISPTIYDQAKANQKDVVSNFYLSMHMLTGVVRILSTLDGCLTNIESASVRSWADAGRSNRDALLDILTYGAYPATINVAVGGFNQPVELNFRCVEPGRVMIELSLEKGLIRTPVGKNMPLEIFRNNFKRLIELAAARRCIHI